MGLETERRALEAASDVYIHESTKQLVEQLKEKPELLFNQMGLLPLEARAAYTMAEHAIQQQNNYEQIGLKALKIALESKQGEQPEEEGTEETEEVKKPSRDFEMLFWSHAKNYSDELIQDMFASILAEEINVPGSVSSRALATISMLSKPELERLRQLNQYLFSGMLPVFQKKGFVDITQPFDEKLLPLERHELSSLSDLGMMKYDGLGTCRRLTINPEKRIGIRYADERHWVCNNTKAVLYFDYLEVLPPYPEVLRHLVQQKNEDYQNSMLEAWEELGFTIESVEN